VAATDVRVSASTDFLRDRFRDVAGLMDGEGVTRSVRGTGRSPNEHDVLAYMAFDASLRLKLHSSNPLERINNISTRGSSGAATWPGYSPTAQRSSFRGFARRRWGHGPALTSVR
jgi:hypothetical protein